MAENDKTVYNVVTRLAERIQYQQLSYCPTNISPSRPGPQRFIFPIGSLAIRLWRPGDDTHLVCLTDNSSNTFWEFIAEKLDREDLPKHDCVVSDPGDRETIWLHHCTIPSHFDIATLHAYGFPKYLESTYVPRVVRRNLSLLQDTWYLINRLGDDVEDFRDKYQTLRSWAEAAGIFSQPFGMLDAESLLWMLFDSKKNPARSNVTKSSVFSDSIHFFVNQYQTLESIRDVLTPTPSNARAPSPRNDTNSCNTIAYEISELAQHPTLLHFSTKHYFQIFCERFKTMILIKAECWVPKQRDAFHSNLVIQITHLPERFYKLNVELETLRIWPHPFRPSLDEWAYVIGVERAEASCFPEALPVSMQELKEYVEGPLLTLDNTVGTAAISVCLTEEARDLAGKYSSTCVSLLHDSGNTPPTLSISGRPSTSNKLPLASQVLARLRWDPAHALYDYEVGYLDRFEGLMWLPLEQWGKETEDEEFIPEHRIRLFRRVGKGSTGAVVWDREKRVCELRA